MKKLIKRIALMPIEEVNFDMKSITLFLLMAAIAFAVCLTPPIIVGLILMQ
jgi:hypothetical protein